MPLPWEHVQNTRRLISRWTFPLQAFPTNAIPMPTLRADSTGQLWIVYPSRDPRLPWPNDGVDPIESNGEIGYGLDYTSYENFVKLSGEIPVDPAGETEQVTAGSG